MNLKNILSLIVILSIFFMFMGCNGAKKLTEEELKEKAIECFNSLEEKNFNGIPLNPTDFYLEQSNSINSTNYVNLESECSECYIAKGSKGMCTEGIEKCNQFSGNINIYDFKLNDDVVVPGEVYGKVLLKDNGEAVGCYITAYSIFQ